MNTTTKIINSDATSPTLTNKLRLCGTRTRGGHWNWCRSPGCDRCRRHRARSVSDSISEWAIAQPHTHTLRKIVCETPSYSTPDELLASIKSIRFSIRRAIDRRQRENERWSSIKIIGYFNPMFSNGVWSASFTGVICLDRVHEVNFLDAIEPLVSVQLQRFPNCVVKNDIHAVLHHSINSTRGIDPCDPITLSTYYNAVHRYGGFKCLVFRRGFQS